MIDQNVTETIHQFSKMLLTHFSLMTNQLTYCFSTKNS